jgi:hypothetical protein
MELTYSTTRALVARTYWRSLRRNRRHQLFWLGWIALAFTLGALMSVHPIRAGLLASVWLIAFMTLVPQLLFKPQQRILVVGPQGLQTRIGTKSGELTWREIARVEREADYVIVTGHNLNAFTIPASAFTSEAACSEAVAQWQMWQRAAATQAT